MLNHDSPRKPEWSENTHLSLMANSITLADPITIRVGRRGVVGLSGRILHVGVDGAWSVSKFINSQTVPVSQSGRLSPYAIRLIAGVLNDAHHGHALASLPSQIGASHINCPIASISVGKINKIAYIEINSPNTPQAPAARAFSDVVSKIMGIVGV